MAPMRRSKERSKRAPAAPRAPQAREVFLLDELGRFVAGSTSAGVPVEERMLKRPAVELARALVQSREIPPGTFLAKSEGDAHAVVYGGMEVFGCAGEDCVEKREVPHELAAVAESFERAAADDLVAGGLSRAMLQRFPSIVVRALADPSAAAKAPIGPLAFARGALRPSGARLALDLEVVNATPWTAERVRVKVAHDPRALPLVSVKARSGGFEGGLLELPPIPARSRDRAVLLFEPRSAGLHVVGGELTLGLEGGRERVAKMRRVRTTVPEARVAPTVPKTLWDFLGLVERSVRHAAAVELPEALGGLATVAGLSTEVEKDHLAKVLDYYPASGGREVWYLGEGAARSRAILVQLTEAGGARAEVVVAAATMADVMAYAARLRGRFDLGYAGAPARAGRVKADMEPEAGEVTLRAAIVAKQISSEAAAPDLETRLKRPRAVTASGVAPMLGRSGGRSAGDEMVPGLLDALERTLGPPRMR